MTSTRGQQKAPVMSTNSSEGNNQISNDQQGTGYTLNSINPLDEMTTVSSCDAADARDAQSWFDANPNTGEVLVQDVIRDNRPGVWKRIFDGLSSRHSPVIDYSGHTVATEAGFRVEPESLLMLSVCSGDESRDIDRARYFVNVGV